VIPFQIRPVFEEHGTIVEVVLLKDKRTGVRQGIYSNYYLYHPHFVRFGLPMTVRSREFNLILAFVYIICSILYLQVLTLGQIC